MAKEKVQAMLAFLLRAIFTLTSDSTEKNPDVWKNKTRSV